MNILCTICDDLLTQDSDNDITIYVTRCGHIFHELCLLQWLCRANTCPQCRSTVRHNNVFRLYPAFSNEKFGEDTMQQLQSCLNDLERQNREHVRDLELQNQVLEKLKHISEAKEQTIMTLSVELKKQKQENKAKDQNIRTLNTELCLAKEAQNSQRFVINQMKRKYNNMMVEMEALKRKTKMLTQENETIIKKSQITDTKLDDVDQKQKSKEWIEKMKERDTLTWDNTLMGQYRLPRNITEISYSELLGQTSDAPQRPSLVNNREAEIIYNSVKNETATDEPDDSDSFNSVDGTMGDSTQGDIATESFSVPHVMLCNLVEEMERFEMFNVPN